MSRNRSLPTADGRSGGLWGAAVIRRPQTLLDVPLRAVPAPLPAAAQTPAVTTVSSVWAESPRVPGPAVSHDAAGLSLCLGLLLVGCQPAVLEDFGGSLSVPVKAAMPAALEAALQRLQAWGADPQPREAGSMTLQSEVSDSVLAMPAYELGRPSAEAACRIGDERFLAGAAACA